MSSKITREWKDKAKIKEELNEGLFIHTGCVFKDPTQDGLVTLVSIQSLKKIMDKNLKRMFMSIG